MARKLKKGYFVKGTFVAEGSELDLELKRQLKGSDEPSRTDLKRESAELQALGEALLDLRADLMERLALPEKLVDAVKEAKRISNFEGRRRQMQFIGKLMRQLDAQHIEQVRQALEEQHAPSAAQTLLLHQTEQWRDRLLADDDALSQWLDLCPATDSQQLRALVRQARKDAQPERPGAALRHGRAYRDIYQLVHETLLQAQQPELPQPESLSGYAGHDA
ncbi:MAG: ribosome biogenesis factor YjgA [Rhodoferax sp.]